MLQKMLTGTTNKFVYTQVSIHTHMHTKQLGDITLHLLKSYCFSNDDTQCAGQFVLSDKNDTRNWHNFLKNYLTHPWKP